MLSVCSHKGCYSVEFGSPFFPLRKGLRQGQLLLMDRRVAGIYSELLSGILQNPSVVFLDASEANKNLETVSHLASLLLQRGISRQGELIAVGGGVTQDLASFLASVLFRGISWQFYPTTLVAQSDSCIGSKSSLNVGEFKNQLGTYHPPQSVWISVDLLQTLSPQQFTSGLGEVIKTHLIGGEKDFCWLRENYLTLKHDATRLTQAIQRSLEVKKELVEKDEFDRGERRLLNYGHSFGHAIESATDYAMPHGIAVLIGIDMANFISWKQGEISESGYESMRQLLWLDASRWPQSSFSEEKFWKALAKDKKNLGDDLFLILTRGPGQVFGKQVPCDQTFRAWSREYLNHVFQAVLCDA